MFDFSIIADFIGNNPILISLAAGLFAGETVILSIAILASGGLFSIWTLLIFSYIGELIADFLYFAIGRTRLIHKLNKIKKFKIGFDKTGRVIDKLTHKNILLTLFYSKFIYGVRTLTIFFLGYRKIPWKKFIVAEVIVMFLAVSLVVGIGYSVGQGYRIALNIFRSFEIAITLAFLTLFISYLMKKNLIEIIKNKLKGK
jgi:membrane protein DedA with SNARE-associated domain|tara:strand:+ start:163 stop:762 length:600 start_codon:yes stop_codon:yes gene_type:complete